MSQELNATVAQRIEVAPGLIIMRVVPDDWELPDFAAGQFAVLGLPGKTPRCDVCDEETKDRDPEKLIKRAYSIASSSLSKEFMEFYLALVPSGALTPRLFSLKVGDKVWLSQKAKGLFTLDEVPADKNVVFISTGTGLAPYMSMLRTHMTCGDSRRFAVVHGARHSWDLGYRSELMTLRGMCSNFSYIPSITRPKEEPMPWGGDSGYIQELWQRGVVEREWGFAPTPENTDVFICGNPSMIEGMVTQLETEGYVEHSRKQVGQIHVERFW